MIIKTTQGVTTFRSSFALTAGLGSNEEVVEALGAEAAKAAFHRQKLSLAEMVAR